MDSNSKLNSTKNKRNQPQSGTKADNLNEKFVYVRRWFRSKHAVIFRLSNKSVQVIFVDQS